MAENEKPEKTEVEELNCRIRIDAETGEVLSVVCDEPLEGAAQGTEATTETA